MIFGGGVEMEFRSSALLLALSRANGNRNAVASGPGSTIRVLEEKAFLFPEERDKILEALEEYAEAHRNENSGMLAQRAAERIAAVSMLEALSGETAFMD